MLVVGFDPGKDHFAYSIVDVNDRTLIKTGMLEFTLYSLSHKPKEARYKYNAFKREVKRLLVGYAGLTPSDLVTLERMQVRPGRGMAPVEITNIMIGAVLGVTSEICGFSLVTASTWKRAVKSNEMSFAVGNCKFCRNRKCNVNLRNKRHCSKWKNDHVFRDGLNALGIDVSTDHEADAVCLACYSAQNYTGKKLLLKKLRVRGA